MLDELLNILNTVGQVVDTPASMLRTAITKRDIGAGFGAAFDTDSRSSGRDMLESIGILNPNTPGLDWGDVAGTATEIVIDPTNLVGAGLLGKFGRYVPELTAANDAERALYAAKTLEAGTHNLGVDSAYRKLDDMLATYRKPADTTIDASSVPGDLREVWTSAYPGITEQQLYAIARGAPHEAGDAILGLKGSRRIEPHPIAAEIANRAGVTAIGHPLIDTERGTLRGFVPTDRPELIFVGDQPLPSTINATVHEMLHSIARRDPGVYADMLSGLGDDTVSSIGRERFGNHPLAALAGALKEGLSVHKEEALAHTLGNSAMRGASRQRFPVTDALHVDWQDVAPDFASLIKERYPSVANPNVIAKGWLESVFDRPRGHELVPIGDVSGVNPYATFSDAPLMTPDELNAIKSGWMAPPDPPSLIDDRNRLFQYLLTLLGAYNTASAPERFN